MKAKLLKGENYIPKIKLYFKFKILIIACAFLLFCQIQLQAQDKTAASITIKGTVVSASDGKPLEGAEVKSSPGIRNGKITDSNGDFSVSRSGTHPNKMIISLEGYDDKEVPYSKSESNLKIELKPINDPFKDRYPKFKALKIGEKVPDIEFAIKNYPTPTAKFSDFKGKLLILDFWTTYCASCIYSFPKMEQLQKRYGDKIQVVFVNVRENEKQIEKRLKETTLGTSQLNTMPSIVSNEAFTQLFPHNYAGNYFWIDPEGILRLSSGIFYNHNDRKVNAVLDGKEITFLQTGKNIIERKEKVSSLLDVIDESTALKPSMSSMITPLDLNYFPFGGAEIGQIDSGSNTIRNTYVNTSILKFYASIFDKSIKEDWKGMLYGPYLGTGKYLNQILVLVKDSSLYDNRLIHSEERNDINMIQSEFCYEQILPLETSIEQGTKYMREDLNRYFGLKYGTKVALEDVTLPCYILKRIDNKIISEKEVRKKLKHLGGREYQSIGDFGSVIGQFFQAFSTESSGDLSPYVFDDNVVIGQRKTIMPLWKKEDSLQDFKLALKANGLDFIKSERKIKMIVIRDNQ